MPKLKPNILKTCGFYHSSTRFICSKQLVCHEFGDPLKVVKMVECDVPKLGADDVLVKMLASPVNPADINTIQGKYPVKLTLPFIPGNEGVGQVQEVGSGVENVSLGDRVIVTKPALGVWREYGAIDKKFLRVVPKCLGLVEAATLAVNPCTAYRMLTDFMPVKEKCLVVLINAANSACGQNALQICSAWGVKCIGVVRNRPEISQLRKYLQSLGATYVLTEEELRTTNIFKDQLIEKPLLALNAVGGKNASDCTRLLAHSGKMVTYGGMSRKPLSIGTATFIFRNISFHGFWVTAWNEKAKQEEKDEMFDDIIGLMTQGQLKGPLHKMVKFDDYEEAIKNALTTKGFQGLKYILDFS